MITSIFSTPEQREATERTRELVRKAVAGEELPERTAPVRYSATTIGNFLACQRKFWWQYVAGVSEPPSRAQEEGTRYHAAAERYLRDRTLPDTSQVEGRMLARALPHLPAAGSVRVEEPFSLDWQLDSGRTINVVGTVDFYAPPTEDGALFVGDHKSSSDPQRYAPTPQELAQNVQANLYAYVLSHLHDEKQPVTLRWVYTGKKPPHVVVPVTTVRTQDELAEYVTTVIEPALSAMERMTRERPRLAIVEPILDECPKYRGCYHREYCLSAPQQLDLPPGNEPQHNATAYRRRKEKEKKNMGILTKSAPQQATTTATQPTPQAAAPQPVSKAAILEAAKQRAANRVNPPPPAPYTPPAPLPAEDLEEAQGVGEEAAPPPPAEKPARKPRAAKAPAATAPQEEPVQRQAPAKGASLRAPGANTGHDFEVFIGAYPSKGGPAQLVSLEVLASSAQADATEASGQAHYLLADYSAGANLLTAAFALWLEANALTGAVLVDPFSPTAKSCLGLLRTHAKRVTERLG